MTAKEEILRLQEAPPYDAIFEDAVERLIVLYDVEQGVKQLGRGQSIPHADANRRIREWLDSSWKPEG